MNDEIKEILEDYSCIPRIKKLGDYITNLQQENEKLSDKIEFYEDVDSDRCAYNEELQEENEHLKENNQNMQEEMARVWKENERLKEELDYIKPKYDIAMDLVDKGVENSYKMVKDYKYRCEKAIEFIKEKISSTKGIINDYMYHKEHNKQLIELLNEDIEMHKNELNILQNGSDSNDPN